LEKSDKINKTQTDFSLIGYYGRLITDLSREELLTAFAELADLYIYSKRMNDQCIKFLGKEKFKKITSI